MYSSIISEIPFHYNDGGRSAAGYKGKARDCVCRAIAIASGKSYQEVYEALNNFAAREKLTSKKPKRSSAREGVFNNTARKYLISIGATWIPTMRVGQGCKVHLRKEELPAGRLVVSLSRHFTAVIDGEIHDTHNPSRDGTRCVYGYYKFD